MFEDTKMKDTNPRVYNVWSDVEVGRVWMCSDDDGFVTLRGDIGPLYCVIPLDRKTMLALRRALNKALAPKRTRERNRSHFPKSNPRGVVGATNHNDE